MTTRIAFVPWRNLLLCALLAIATTTTFADTWRFKSTQRELKFSQGLRIVQTVDASKNPRNPAFHLRMYVGTKQIAHFPGVALDDIVESPDGYALVGLSNRGLPGVAVVVLSRDGRISLFALHNVAEFDYCEKSTTLVRRWYDHGNPNIRFDGPAELGGITLRDCKGEQVSLLPVLAKAYERALQPRAPAENR